MRNKLGIACLVLGTVFLLGALGLFLYNQHEAGNAEKAAVQVMPQLLAKIEAQQTEPPTLQPDAPSNDPQMPPEEAPAPEPDPDPEPQSPVLPQMTETEIDGHSYIGYISIPVLNLELPIMADWDYNRLKTAPCRYTGSIYTSDLVLMGHNYTRHFGPLRRLSPGDSVLFVDMNGITTTYAVVALDILNPTAVEEMTAGDFDLTLFTCTYGGQTRLTVYCNQTPD